jgi:light-regulated signal transduction histidine kinase (bacteriophytochrome)
MELRKEETKYKTLFDGKSKELEQFSYIVSHDLQTPLRNIILFTELLEMDYEASAETKAEYVSYIKDSAHQASEQIKMLLTYSRLGTGKEIVKVDLEQVLSEVKVKLSHKIGISNAVILSDSLPVIRCFPNEMEELFFSLLDNAIKFKKVFNAPFVKISCESFEGYWRFTVSDNGIGIQESNFENIFLIFRRVHHREKYEGAGFGLAMAKKIVELHDGNISVVSELGRGSEFVFTISKQL